MHFHLELYFNFRQANMRLQNEDGINTKDVQHFKNYKEKHYTGHKKCPTALAWNTQGNLLITAESIIKIWNFNEKDGLQKSHEIKGHEYNIQWAQFANKNLLGTLSRQSLRFCDIRQTHKVQVNKIEKKGKYDLLRFAWGNTENNEKIALVTKENVVLLYDFRNTGVPFKTLAPKNSMQICGASWDRSNSVLFVIGGQSNYGSITLFNTTNYEIIADPIHTHFSRIVDISFSNDNQYFATASEDSLLQLHSIPEIICERAYSSKTDSIFKRVSFNFDGKYLAASSDGNFIEIYNAKEGGQGHRLRCSQVQQVLSWHPNKSILAYIDQQDKKRSLDRGDDSFVHLFYQS